MKRGVTILLCCLWLLVVVVMVNVSGGSLIDQVPRFMLLSSSIESGSEFIGLDCDSDCLYGLLALKTDEGEAQTYRIVALSEDGQTLAATPVFELSVEEDGDISDFAFTSQGFYLTMVSTAKETASAYFIEAEYLSEDNLAGNEDETDEVIFEAALSLTAGDGRQINWAGYEDDAFVSWKDDGTGVEYYISDAAGDAESEQFLMDAGQEANNQQFYVICDLVLLFAGFGVIVLAVRGLYHKSYTVYMTALTEILLFVLTFGGAAFLSWTQGKASAEENEKLGRYYLEIFSENVDIDSSLSPGTESFYSEEQYYALWMRLSDFVQDERTEGLFEDICLIRSDDQRILVSASGQNGAVLSDLYDNAENLTEVTMETGGGVSYTLKAVGAGKSGWLLAGTSVRVYFGTAAILFLLLSVVCCRLLLRQGGEITKLSQAMLAASGGQEVPFEGKVRSKDVSIMWNSFMELQKKISRINYTRYRIYESCYRFAPKDIEKIFGRDSITEVAGGDCVRLKGTMAFVTSDEPESVDEASAVQMSGFITLMERHQEESGGFFVPGNSDLTSLRILFLEDNPHSVDFGVSLLNDFYALPDTEGMRAGILLHYSELLYAVAGNDHQCFPFLLSEEKEEMESFAAWFRELDLRLVITHEVKNRENFGEPCRYIGYLLLEKSGRKLELYEVLNACSPAERRLKMDTEEKFQKAVRLFYQHDFYLARSSFSDVLKANPLDKICKWYLFTCEKYLNQAYSADDICRLRPDA